MDRGWDGTIKVKEDSNITGEALYHRFINGDTDAFEELVKQYEDELSFFLYKYVNDHHDARHLMIEAFACLAASTKQFKAESSVKTYLFAIGKNLAIRHVKKRSRDQHVSFDEVSEALVDEDNTPHEYIEREEVKKLLHDAIGSLKAEHHDVLKLIYFENMSYAETGRVMGKSEKQIKHLVFRAKAALKRRLSSEGFGIN